jgi:hypothetical protein
MLYIRLDALSRTRLATVSFAAHPNEVAKNPLDLYLLFGLGAIDPHDCLDARDELCERVHWRRQFFPLG